MINGYVNMEYKCIIRQFVAFYMFFELSSMSIDDKWSEVERPLTFGELIFCRFFPERATSLAYAVLDELIKVSFICRITSKLDKKIYVKRGVLINSCFMAVLFVVWKLCELYRVVVSSPCFPEMHFTKMVRWRDLAVDFVCVGAQRWTMSCGPCNIFWGFESLHV